MESDFEEEMSFIHHVFLTSGIQNENFLVKWKSVTGLSQIVFEEQVWKPQSRQSAKRFSSRWNWDSPTPLAQASVPPPTLWSGGGGTLKAVNREDKRSRR